MGSFTAPAGDMHKMARSTEMLGKRTLPIMGNGEGRSSMIHVDDVARAVILASEHGASAIFTVVDDDPAPMKAWHPAKLWSPDSGVFMTPLLAPRRRCDKARSAR